MISRAGPTSPHFSRAIISPTLPMTARPARSVLALSSSFPTRYETPAALIRVYPYGRQLTCVYEHPSTGWLTWWSMIRTSFSENPRSSMRFCWPAPRSEKILSEESAGTCGMVRGSSCRTKTERTGISCREIACDRIASQAMPSASMWEMMVTSGAAAICSAAAFTSSQKPIAYYFGMFIHMNCT